MKLAAFTMGLAALFTGHAVKADDTPAKCPPFEMVGEGPDLILTPGLGSSPAVWDGVVESLAADYRVTLIHIAGFAGRDAARDPGRVIEYSADEIIRHLDCHGIANAAYTGHSLGGFVGLKLAAEQPERLNRLVVVDALPFYPLVFSPAATVETVRGQAEGFRAQILSQEADAFEASQRLGVRALVKNTKYHDTVVGWSLDSDRATFAAAIHTLMTTDLRPRLDAITTPTTVLVAANPFAQRDRVEPLYQSAYDGLVGVRINIIEDSYHFIMFDQPDAFENALREALSGTGSTGQAAAD